MLRAHAGMAVVGKVGYTLGCMLAALVLVGSGFAYYVKGEVGSIGGSNVLTGGPQTGAMNILPADLLAAMHAGSVQGVANGVGGQATNTLILIHIFAGGQM